MIQIFIFLVILFLLDLYVFQAVKIVSREAAVSTKRWIYILFWIVSVASLGMLMALPYLRAGGRPSSFFTYAFAVAIGIVITKLIAVSFFVVDDLRRVIQWGINQLWVHNTDNQPGSAVKDGISRSTFLSWLGIGVGTTLFGTLLYGFSNQYNYQTRKIKLSFANLPQAFKGLKIVQISDIHSGSFMNKEAVMRGVDAINALEPDLILFTGDLVNDRAVEMAPYVEVFNKLDAKMGVYSVLGNHDYGDYASWKSEAEKQANLQALKQTHAQMGWRLLLDEAVNLEKDGAAIRLIGVQNISGRANFHSYGNLQQAYADSAAFPFKILMSHDPSHWESEVRDKFPDIDLTLSGHTHGMQFGVEIPGFKWSPVQWVYKHWAGLYEKAGQKLYVNRGFGFIGYPGRVGILPEITLIELG